jgi:hypothetical protein
MVSGSREPQEVLEADEMDVLAFRLLLFLSTPQYVWYLSILNDSK